MSEHDELLEALHILTLRAEWADIANRKTSPCLWLASRRMAGKKTTESDCQIRMMEIENELHNIQLNKGGR